MAGSFVSVKSLQQKSDEQSTDSHSDAVERSWFAREAKPPASIDQTPIFNELARENPEVQTFLTEPPRFKVEDWPYDTSVIAAEQGGDLEYLDPQIEGDIYFKQEEHSNG